MIRDLEDKNAFLEKRLDEFERREKERAKSVEIDSLLDDRIKVIEDFCRRNYIESYFDFCLRLIDNLSKN